MNLLQHLLGLGRPQSKGQAGPQLGQALAHAVQGLPKGTTFGQTQGPNIQEALQSGGLSEGLSGMPPGVSFGQGQDAGPAIAQGFANGGLQPQRPGLGVRPQHAHMNLGVPYGAMGQGGEYNPGYTPLQNSGFGGGGNPQQGSYQPYMQNQYGNPQDNPYQQYWLQ